MKRWVLWGSVAVAVALWVVYLNRPQPKLVQVVKAAKGLVEHTVANTRVGSVQACDRSRLSPAIGGQVAKLYVKEGDRVEANALLLELWNSDRKALLRQAEAVLNFSERDSERICINSAADAREARRIERLADKKLASEEAKDQSQSRAQASKAACDSSQARLEEAHASVAVAQAALDQTFLRAPFAGVVAEVTGEVGEFTTPSPPGVPTPPAIDLLTDSCYYITAPIDEVDAAHVKAGMPVRVSVDAFRGEVFSGTVRRVSAYVQDFEKQARTVDVEVSLLPEDQSNLIAGYSADVEIVVAQSENTLRVPSDALRENGAVFVMSSGGVVISKPVKVGLTNWRFSEIVSGLSEGETVILALGRTDLAEGDSVTADISVSDSEGRQ